MLTDYQFVNSLFNNAIIDITSESYYRAEMMRPDIFFILLSIWSGFAVTAFVLLFFIPAPYGKIRSKGWGLEIPSRTGWVVMETVSLTGMALLFFTGRNKGLPCLLYFLLWNTHYIYRSIIFPFIKKTGTKNMPVAIMCSGMFFNVGNSFFNGYALFHLYNEPDITWLLDLRFLSGAALFLAGFIINIHSDRILRKLRTKNDTSYKIPYGGLFRFISCPNYFGEILEWSGWAMATWSWAGFTFMIWTIANLAPRAFTYHQWYRQTFPEYPKERRALIPFLL